MGVHAGHSPAGGRLAYMGRQSMTARLYRLPASGSGLLTKKQLASYLGRSTRWVEMQVRDGMPVERSTGRFGERRYDVARVEAWLRTRPHKVPTVSLADRVAALERQLNELKGMLG